MIDQGTNGRSQSSAWRALHAEGILWDGPVFVVDGANELPLRLIATNHRLAFTKGGEFALEIPREWLHPAPFLNPDGSVNLTVDAGEGARPERLQLNARDGRRLAVDLIAALNKSRPSRTERSMTIYAPEPLVDLPDPPMARGRRSNPPARTRDEADEALLALLDLDDFPPLSGQTVRTRPVIIVDDDLPPAEITAAPAGSPTRDGDWSLQPIALMSNRTDRHARRGWAIRLSGLILLLTIAAAFGSGRVPALPGRDLASHIPDSGISAPFGADDPTATIAAELAQVETPKPEPTPTVSADQAGDPARPTLPPSETAIALGVGGMEGSTLTAAVELTTEPMATPTTEPTATPTEEPTSTPTETAEPEPTNTERVEAAAVTETDEPEPTATTEPTAEPTNEPTPTATLEPTQEPTSTPTLEPTATTEPTLEPTVETPQIVVTEPVATPEATVAPTETPEPTATPTTEPTATPTVEPSPTPTPTAEPSFPSQKATLGEGELPAQVFTGGPFRFTIEAVVRSTTIDSLALTQVPGVEWLLVMVHAENWSEADALLGVGNLQVLTYGAYGVASAFPDPVSGVIAQTLNLDPALGPADVATLAPGEGRRLALVYLIRPDTTELQLTTGLTTMDLGPALGQPVDFSDPGDEPASPEMVSATVTRALDGQTIMVETEDGARARVRYLGVQAPIGSACYAEESLNANAALTLGKTVYLERERKNRAPNSQIARDVWIAADDGTLTLVSAVLAAGGSVVAAPVEPDVRFAGWIKAAADGAQFSLYGLWGACGGLQTPVPEPTAAPDQETPVAETEMIEPAVLLKRLFI